MAKTGGRTKGTPNKLTSETRATLASILNNELEKLPSLLGELQPQQRADVIMKLAKLVLPAQKSVEITDKLESKAISLADFYSQPLK